MNSYLFDTSTIINLFRGKKEEEIIVNSLDGDQNSSFICFAELYEGVTRSQNRDKEEENVIQFFSKLHNVFGIDQDIAKHFGEIRAKLKAQGNVIEDLDILIAATCIAHNQILVTHNKKHFSHVSELKIF